MLDTTDTDLDETHIFGLASLRRHLTENAHQTQRAYLGDWKRWTHWCRTNDRTPLPAHPTDIALFLAHAHDTRGASPATLRRWASAIATAHAANGYPEPTSQDPLAPLLGWIRQAEPRPRYRNSRRLTDAELTRVLSHTREESWPELVIHRRDRLIMLLTRATGDRPEEILELRAGQLRLDGHTVTLHAKGAPLALANPLPAADWGTCLPCSLVLWRQALDLAEDSTAALRQVLGDHRLAPRGHVTHALEPAPNPDNWLLRRVRRGGTITADRMATDAIRVLLRKHATAARVDPTGLTSFALRPPS